MFANFTEETCTGTGTTLALAGASAGAIPFSASFADGDLVSYVVDDSGGSIKVAGIGTYVSATDDITRNDTWNYNGTVVDKNPSTNITLSGGTHTIRCDLVFPSIQRSSGFTLSAMTSNHEAMPDNWVQVNDGSSGAARAGRVHYTPVFYSDPVILNTLSVHVSTSSATDVVQVGICTCGSDGLPDNVIEIVTVDVTAAGRVKTSLSQDYKLEPGRYFTFISSSDYTATFWNVSSLSHAGRSGAYVYRNGLSGGLSSTTGAPAGIITIPLETPNNALDPLQTVFILPEFV